MEDADKMFDEIETAVSGMELDMDEVVDELGMSRMKIERIIHALVESAREVNATYLELIQACQSVMAATNSQLELHMADVFRKFSEEPPEEVETASGAEA